MKILILLLAFLISTLLGGCASNRIMKNCKKMNHPYFNCEDA